MPIFFYCKKGKCKAEEYIGKLEEAVTKIATMQAEIDELKETLAFYADPETYFAIGFFPDPPCGEFMEDFSDTGVELGFRAGKRARVALNIEIEQPKEQE